MAEELFRKKISKEEKLYQEAVQLQEAISCVVPFERKVSALKSAADKFEGLESYKDSAERMKVCRQEAERIDMRGARDTYEEALRKQQAAVTKSDYVDVIAEFRRVIKKEEYEDDARAQIQLCKNKIASLENIAVWKRRIKVLVVLAVCMVLFLQTPLYPFAKGFIHQQQGKYELAIANYKEAKGLSWTKDLKASCYYKLGMEELEQGNKKKAMHLFQKAKGNKKAHSQLKQLEKELTNYEK